MRRREFLTAGAAATACALGAVHAPRAWARTATHAGNAWPTQPLRIINAYPPGGIVDILARLIGAELTASLGQPTIVEDKPGAGGNIGTAYVARAAGNPYTLLLGASGPLAINVSLYKNLTYDPTRDFTPISLLAATPLVLVTGSQSGIHSFDDLLKRMTSSTSPPFYGSAGTGTPQHLAGEMLKQQTGARATHVPYKGGAPAVMAVLGGEVQYAFENLVLVKPHIEAGRMKALAVSSADRTAQLPDVPTVAQGGVPGFEARGWYGLLAPAGIAPDVAQRLTEATIHAAREPKVRQMIASLGSENVSDGPQAFAELIAAEISKWRAIIQAGNISLDG